MANIAGAKERMGIIHRPLRAGGLEARRMPHGPARQETTVAATHHPEPLGIDKIALLQGSVDPGHDVGKVTTAPVANHLPHERLAVTLAAARIGVEHHVPGTGVYLKLVEKCLAVLYVRPTMDVEQGGIAFAGRKAIGLHDPTIEPVTGAFILQALRLRQGHLGLPGTIEVRKLLLTTAVGMAEKHFGRRDRISGSKRQARAVLTGRESGDLPPSADDACRCGIAESSIHGTRQ